MSALLGTVNLAVTVARNGITGNELSDALAINGQGYNLQESEYLTVANGVSNQVISLGPITTGQFVLLMSDQIVSFKVNGAAVGLQASSLMLNDAALTSLTVSNSSGFQANVRVILLGS